jgi:glycosyltransferase XagB
MLSPVPLKPAATGAAVRRHLLGETLVEQGLLDAATLAAALEDQREQDAPLGRILLTSGAISSTDLTAALGRQAGLLLVDLRDSPPSPELLEGLDPHALLALEAVPWRQFGGTRVLALSNSHSLPKAAAALGAGAARVEAVLAPPEDIRKAIIDHFDRALRDDARTRCPGAYSCRDIGARRGRWRVLAGAAALAAGVLAAPLVALQALAIWILVMNAMTMGLRLSAIVARFRARRAPAMAAVPRLSDYQKLPTVSILVPLKGRRRWRPTSSPRSPHSTTPPRCST